MALGKPLRRGGEVRRSQVLGRRVDPIARHAQRFRGERNEFQIGIRRRLDACGIALGGAIAVEPIGTVGESESQLRGLFGRELLGQMKAARRQALHEPGRMP